MLKWFAGHQIRNVVVSVSPSTLDPQSYRVSRPGSVEAKSSTSSEKHRNLSFILLMG